MSDEQQPGEPNFENVEEFLKSIGARSEAPIEGEESNPTVSFYRQWVQEQRRMDAALEDVNRIQADLNYREGQVSVDVSDETRLLLYCFGKKLDCIRHQQRLSSLLFGALLHEIRQLRTPGSGSDA